MNHKIKANLIKNAFVILISVLLFPLIITSLSGMEYEQTNNFLLILSMFLVTVCFANFAFTYEKSNLKTKSGAMLAHLTTGWFMLLTALLLECIAAVAMFVHPSLYSIILVFSIMLYIGIVLYDFWDLFRAM